MPYCTNCGTESSGKFCPNCGTPMNMGASASSGFPNASTNERTRSGVAHGSPYTSANERSRSGVSYGSPYSSPGGQSGVHIPAASDPKNYKLGWHKWLIYFVLWFAALVDISNGGIYLSLVQEFSQYVEFMPDYTPYVAAFGLLCIASIAMGVYCIYVRFQLAKFKKNAVKKLLILLGVTAAFNLVSSILLMNLGASADDVGAGSFVMSLVMMVINWRYYSSREELFVN